MAKKTQTSKKMENKSRSLKDTLKDLGHKFDEKLQEEIKQFNDMGGIAHAGEYVAQNAVSAASMAFTGMGLKGVADDVESTRETIIAQSRKVDERVQKEIKQFKDMGGVAHAGEYVAQNAVSAVSAAFTGMGLKGVSKDVESTRATIIAQSQKIDDRVQEEVKKISANGGIYHLGSYVAQNAVATVSEKKFERRIRKSEQKKKEEQEKANKFRENMNKYGAVKSAADFFNRT